MPWLASTPRTLRRWKAGDGLIQGDRRPDADRAIPSHALSEAERARIIEVANEPRFAETPPARIVPALADEGIYLASEASFHRVLRAHGQMNRRGRPQPPRTSRPPSTHIATRPGEVWCWDVTFLPAQIQGHWFYLYLILDLYSRKVVGFDVHDTDSAEHAVHSWPGMALRRGSAHPCRCCPVLHGDNGATLEGNNRVGHAALARHQAVQLSPAGRGDDNAFAEASCSAPRAVSAGVPALKGVRQTGRRTAMGGRASCNGITTNTAIAASATSPRRSVMPDWMAACSPPATRSTRMHAHATPQRWSRADPQLDTGWRRVQRLIRNATLSSRRRDHRKSWLSGSIGQSAFPSRPGRCPSHGAQRRRWEERSHPQPRAARPVARERGEAGERRTFSAVSTVARSSPVGGSHRRTSTPQAQRFRREEESLRGLSGNHLDTHRRGTTKPVSISIFTLPAGSFSAARIFVR